MANELTKNYKCFNTSCHQHGCGTTEGILSCPYAIHTCDFSLPFMNYAITPNSRK